MYDAVLCEKFKKIIKISNITEPLWSLRRVRREIPYSVKSSPRDFQMGRFSHIGFDNTKLRILIAKKFC